MQLTLFDSQKVIETIRISPTKEMPLEVFKECYRFSAFAELMERTPEGHVIWNPDLTEIYSEQMEDVVYHMVQNDWIGVTLEVPKEFFGDGILEENGSNS